MAADFSWDSSEQGIIQSSIFWGYAATQVLGGLLATRFGQQLSLWMRFAMRLNQSVFWGFSWDLWFVRICFFPRASERRVLLKVEVCYTSSYVHIFITSSSHLHHIFSPSHLHILTYSSSYPHIFSSSHLHIFTSSHPHIFTSSHLHIFTSSHLHILTSSHLHIFTSSHHFHIFTSSLSLSSPLSRSLSFFFFSLLKRQAVLTRRHEMATFSHEMRFDCQKLR